MRDGYVLSVNLRQYGMGAIPSYATDVTTTTIEVDGKEYPRTTTKTKDGKVFSDKVTIKRGDVTLDINLKYKDDVYDEGYSQIFEQIFSTFKFTQ
jgi:hypothetical protein